MHHFHHGKKHLIALRLHGRITQLGLVVFVSSVAFSLISTVWSVYINSFLNSEALVGLLSSFFIALSFISYFIIIPLIERSDKFKLAVASTFLMALGYLTYAFIPNFYLFLLVASVMTVLLTIRISAMGILVKENSTRGNLAKNEGIVYTILNLAYLVGPLLASLILLRVGEKSLFIVAGIILASAVFILRAERVKHGGRKKHADKNVMKNFIDFFKNKDRVKAYLLGGGVNFWWSAIYIYLPLIIIRELSEKWIGVFLAAVVIQMILFEYRFASFASRTGYKKIFFIGFLIPAIAAILCAIFFNVWFLIVVLTLASIGLSMVESTTESYFFDISKGKEDQRFYSPYNTAIDVGAIFGQLVPALFLFFFPIRYIFVIYAAGMFFLAIVSLSVKNVYESKRHKHKRKLPENDIV